ncbi:MAG TPA: GNAT family N-acetyltransferase [Xanthobacteraceae bacterium]|nr:GNAT family N-acetyltransferase [Xanthobacteraceae bacterium]
MNDGQHLPTSANRELRLTVVESIGAVDAIDWDSCANPRAKAARDPLQTPQAAVALDRAENEDLSYSPFTSHGFLSALEESKSVGPRTGWQPRHILARTPEGLLLAAAPCYFKSHSRGEYVFDHGWAEAYERAGGSYYPKLQIAVPFTPATGRRLLLRPGAQSPAVARALATGLIEICKICGASGVHVTFATEAEFRLLGELGYLQRTDQQFHWENRGFESFDDFLAALTARKRKTIRRERHDALANGISVHWLTGSDLTEEVWDAFFQFYMETGSRKWGRPYLTRPFYSLVGQTMRERIVLIMAKRAGRWIAGAINFLGSRTLFGRHWGAIEHHPFLHFELCYYQAIDYAIAHKVPRVEAGAQGEHKIARGYMPATTYSAHYIADPALRRAIAEYLQRERAYIAAAGAELATLAPFRKNFTAEPE